MALTELVTSPTWLMAVAFAFVAGLLLTEAAIMVAHRFRLHAIPNARSSHDVPTAQLGGLGAAVPTLAWLFYVVLAAPHLAATTHLFFYLFFGSSLLFFAIGLWDDLSNLSPKRKLAAQFVAAGLATEVIAAITVAFSGAHGAVLLWGQILAAAVWLIWVVGFVNAFNFMDGMNGNAGLFTLTSLIFALVMMSVRTADGPPEPWFAQVTQIPPQGMALPIGITIGAVAGFMVFNCRPVARVFLGDCGSHFLGCFLATMAFAVSTSLLGPGLSLLAFVTLLMPFLYDVMYTLIRRGLAGRNVWEAHREHLYQRLLLCGLSHMRVLAICGMTYVACGLLAVVCVQMETLPLRLACAAGSFGVMVVYTLYTMQVENRGRGAVQPGVNSRTQSAAK